MAEAPDLPCDDDSAGVAEYADTVIRAVGDRGNLVVAAQSLGGFTAPLVAARMRRVVADRLGIVPDEIAAGHAVALSPPGNWPTCSPPTRPRWFIICDLQQCSLTRSTATMHFTYVPRSRDC